ncbi:MULTISPECIES: hypothetical protein [unclassified Fusibacter]|uniref:hypothetical protein n=1 Tax=unclassified Fusibacter TaxID=2624464 RepID=UPI001013A220|nr:MULTISPECIES: hypothetical protein [unclassified Fusibacter]MCK8060104.1 hypothetical protein [Fusibacter sp. A2]NPE22246.1 hypothetical protein [Fusibacter sp. A1]RXV61020.1 hypothetical protein DWB64_10400 [Fusibacter sp. A1]
MNTELIYTIGVGNLNSYVCIFAAQLSVYLTAVDMYSPIKGSFIALIFASVISMSAMLVIYYYNSEMAVKEGQRLVTNLKMKKKVFRNVMLVFYGVSILILGLLFLTNTVVASYFKVTGPISVLIVGLLLGVHDLSVNGRYAKLSRVDWVFDYSKEPVIRSLSKGNNAAIKMFDEKKQFIGDKKLVSVDLERVLKEIPPGSKLIEDQIKKPRLKTFEFKYLFNYTGITTPKFVYLKKETKDDLKLIKHYLDCLSRYSGIYEINEGTARCCKATISINDEKIEKFINDDKYIKKFVAATDTEVASISIQLTEELLNYDLERLVKILGRPVTDYTITRKKDKIVLFDYDTESKETVDISYLKDYMSISLDDYRKNTQNQVLLEQQLEHQESDQKAVMEEKIQPEEQIEHKYHSFEERVKSALNVKAKGTEEDKTNGLIKTLYRINLKGKLVYLFLEDFRTAAEVDKLIITHFINKDIKDMLKKVNIVVEDTDIDTQS